MSESLPFRKVVPWRQVVEGRHGEALGAREGDEGQAVFGRRAEAAAAGQVKDHTRLGGQAYAP